MSCLIKVTSGNFQDHFSSLWLYYYYSIKYLARVANAGADRKLKNKTTKAILHGGFQPAGQLFTGSYPALFIKLSSSLLTMVVLPWSFTSRLEDGLRAGTGQGRLGRAPGERLPAGRAKVLGSLPERVGSSAWETGRAVVYRRGTGLCSGAAPCLQALQRRLPLSKRGIQRARPGWGLSSAERLQMGNAAGDSSDGERGGSTPARVFPALILLHSALLAGNPRFRWVGTWGLWVIIMRWAHRKAKRGRRMREAHGHAQGLGCCCAQLWPACGGRAGKEGVRVLPHVLGRGKLVELED